jgi:hypothetical protein
VVTFELTCTADGGTHLRVDHRVVAVAAVIPFKLRKRTVTSGSSGPCMMLRLAA